MVRKEISPRKLRLPSQQYQELLQVDGFLQIEKKRNGQKHLAIVLNTYLGNDMKMITTKFLKDHDACETTLYVFKRNCPTGRVGIKTVLEKPCTTRRFAWAEKLLAILLNRDNFIDYLDATGAVCSWNSNSVNTKIIMKGYEILIKQEAQNKLKKDI